MKSNKSESKDDPDIPTQKAKEAEGDTNDASDKKLVLPDRRRKSLTRTKSVSTNQSSISSFGTKTKEVLQPGQKFVEKDRPKWSNEYDSIIVTCGSAVGIFNIARFPIEAYRNGGTAFLIPYILFLFLCAFPIMYQQRILGQFVQQGCISVWKIVPIFKGIGYAIQLISILFVCYYSATLGWAVICIFESLNTTLSSTVCGNKWNTPSCIIPTFASYNKKENNTNPASAGREYFRGRILRLWPSEYSDGDAADEALLNTENDSLNRTTFGFHTKLGRPNLDLTGCMFFIFFLYFLALLLGIRLTRKIAWISVVPVSIVLPILLFRGTSLEGAEKGLLGIATPNFKALLLPATWARAAMLAISSTSVGDSLQMNLASLNYFKHDTFRDAVITVIADTVTNIITTLVIFCWIGCSAYEQNVNVTDVVGNITDGSDLIFALFTDVTWPISGARFFILVFYIVVFLVGFSSVVPTIQAIMMGYMDEFTKWFPPETNSEHILNFTLVSWAFIASLACCTRGGIWMFKFMGIYATSISLPVCVFLQMVVVSWIWGLEDLCNAADAMTGRMPGMYLRLCWKFITPILLVLLVFFGWADLTTTKIQYNGGTAPDIVKTAGIWITLIPLFFIPIFAIYQLIHYPADSFKLKLRLLFYPENEHHDIRKGRIPPDRFNFSHICYLGLSDAFRKKLPVASKPKIHPSKASIPRESKPFLDEDEEAGVDSTDNFEDEIHSDNQETTPLDPNEESEIPLTNAKKKKSSVLPQPEIEPESLPLELEEEKESLKEEPLNTNESKKRKKKKKKTIKP